MKRSISSLLALISWFALLTQYFLMIENSSVRMAETNIRFFSYFTILTNSIVVLYYTVMAFDRRENNLIYINKPGILTSITAYITIVGLVYQVLLRQLWEPHGLQKLVDELLHTFIPVGVILFWYLYENKTEVKYIQIFKWLIYPLVYLIYILVRGNFSNFYPYPFVDVNHLGLEKVIINSLLLIALFISISVLYIRIGKLIRK